MFQMTFSYTPWKTKFKQSQQHRHWLGAGLLFIAVILSLCCGQVIADVDDKDDSSIKVNVESTYNSLKFTLDENPEEYVLQNVTCKSVKNVEITGNDEHICENLDPCSTYLVVLDIKSLLSDPPFTFDRTMDAKTEYAEPTVEFDQVTPDIDHIDISWKATNATCIMEYKIEVKSTEKELHYQLSDKLELRVNELNPCQLYNITIKVIDVLSPIPVVNLTTSTRTEYAEPGDVSVTFTDDSRGSVRVQWETPMYKTCITAYHLKWFISDCTTELGTASLFNETAIEENVCEWSVDLNDPNSVEYVLRNLQGCEDYGFEMYINQNSTAKANEQFVSPEQVPGPVVEQNLEINSTYVNITWQPPKTHKKCVANYTVIVVGPLQTEPQTLQTVTSLTSLKIEDLNPCGQYNLTIIAVSRNSSEALPKSSTFELSEAKPSVVRNITIQPFSSASEVSLSISWEIPEVAYLCVAKYRMSGWTDDNVNVEELDKRDIRETSIKIVGLTSCQAYVVQIIPVTRNDLDGQLTQTQTVTDAVVAKAPNNFLVVGLYPHRLELSAQESDKTNKCETISARFICTSVDDNATHKVAEQYVNDGQVGGISFKAVLSPLSPFVEYRCQVSLFNIAGWSQPKVLLQKTEQYFPDRPENLTIKASTNTSLTFSWTRPKFPNGVIKLYNTYFQMYERAYFVPPSCNIFVPEPMLRQTSNTEQNFGSLQPYTKYSMQIATQNDYGIGEYTRPFIVTTKPWVSDPVPYVTAKSEGPYLYDNEYRASVEVTWLAPCKSNGNIEQFYLHFLGERVNKTSEIFVKKIDPNLNADGYMSYNETDLKPEYNYTVIVSIKTQDVEELSVGMRATFDAPAGIPTTPGESILNQTRVNAFDSNNPTKTAVVRFPRDMLDSESGTVLYMALLVSEKNCNPEPQLRFDAIDALKEWPETLSWYDAYQDSNCISQYQTTPIQWRPAASAAKAMRAAGGVRFTPRDNEIVYVIGTDECNDKTTYYCNGPLKPDTEYNLVFRLFTKSGYRDSYMLEFRTDSVIQVTLILICVCSCLLFAFITGLIYLYITKRIQWNRESCNSVVDALGDIIPKNFATYYCDIAKPEKIAREFKELSGVAMDLSCAASELGTTKNRYTDIYPYDKNRVILDIDADGSDYINASFIDGYNRKKEYIATQGPKAESTMDFWRMILQYNVRVIVQVTQFREGDVIKCHQYFPFQSKGLVVTVKKKETFELYDRTEISASHDVYGLKQKVVHYYFKKWLDHECPADPNQLITFIKKVKTEKVPSYSPIVVHCSAGVGRTGTLIGLDIVMQRIKNESKINIFETVKKLRFQRMKMVQTQAQYAFLYKCTYELVKHKKAKQPVNTKKNGKSVSFQDDNDLNENQTFPETLNGIKIDTINARTSFGPKPKLRIIKYDDDVIIEDADEKF